MEFEMEKVYNPQAIEGKLYQMWEESGAFIAKRRARAVAYMVSCM